MQVEKNLICCWLILLLCCLTAHGQSGDSTNGRLAGFPSGLLGKIQAKTARMDQQLTSRTQKYLAKMERQEKRLRDQLYKVDSTSAKKLFENVDQRYASLTQKLTTDTGGTDRKMQGPYMAYVDSLKTSLAFLRENPSVAGAGVSSKLQGASEQLRQLQSRLQDATEIKQFLQQRKDQIRQYLQQYTHLPAGVTSAFGDYKKQAYYYAQQVQSYKEELNDPDKLLRRGLQALNTLPAFSNFMKKNSMLASLFNVPTSGGSGSPSDLQGMASRDQVLAAVRGTSIPGSSVDPAAGLQQSVNSAQGQVDGLRNKLPAGNSGGDLDVPDFKPNGEKTKSFFRRLEYGVNLQSTRSSYYFPTTTDIGLSLGYKLDSKNVIGVGVSCKIGWGSDISHVRVTGEGLGLRSFADIHLSKSFFATGGFEYNYQQPFNIQGLPGDLSNWQKSGLIGASKIISMKSRALKNTKIQLLWDFLSYQQRPKAQPVKFRIGYSF